MQPDVLQAKAQDMGLSMSSSQARALQVYVGLLLKWNKVYNLTALRQSDEVWSHHILDSLAALAALLSQGGGAKHILDVGSGGGLPGVVWAIMQPAWQVTCLDAVAKKMAFVQQASHALALSSRLQAVHCRVQDHSGQYDVITSRAFAALSDFVSCTPHLLAANGHWFALKGKYPEQELAQLAHDWPQVEVFHVEQLQVPDLPEQRCVLWMRPQV